MLTDADVIAFIKKIIELLTGERKALEARSEAALALIRAIVIGDAAAKAAAYQRLHGVWSQTEIDNLAFDVEALFRAYTGYINLMLRRDLLNAF